MNLTVILIKLGLFGKVLSREEIGLVDHFGPVSSRGDPAHIFF